MSEKRKYKMVLGEDGKRHRVYKEETVTCEQASQEELNKQWEELKAKPLPPYMEQDEKLTQAIKKHKIIKVILIIVSVLGSLLLGVILSK